MTAVSVLVRRSGQARHRAGASVGASVPAGHQFEVRVVPCHDPAGLVWVPKSVTDALSLLSRHVEFDVPTSGDDQVVRAAAYVLRTRRTP